jgi:DNA-directed RNA polymerase subunit RPC12/RpoP
MGIIDDTMKALERIPLWKRVSHLPDEVAGLRARIEAIEKRLEGKTGIECPICGALDFKRTKSEPSRKFAAAGVMLDLYRCSACNHQETRMRETFQRSR